MRPATPVALPAGAFGLAVWWASGRLPPGAGFGSVPVVVAAVLASRGFLPILLTAVGLLAALWWGGIALVARRSQPDAASIRRALAPLLWGASLPALALVLDAFCFWPTAPPLAALGLGLGALGSARRLGCVGGGLLGADGRCPRLLITLLSMALPLTLLAGGWSPPSGDEPHYLTVAHSLVEDHDLDLAADFRERRYAAVHPQALSPHYREGLRPGSRYSMHGIGLPLLIAPAYAAGRLLEPLAPGAAVALPRLLLVLMYGAFSWLLYGFVEELATARAAGYGTAATVLLAPLLFAPLFLFPETPAMLLSLLAFRGLSRPHGGGARHGVALAALPFVGIKYLPLAAAIFVAGVWAVPAGGRMRRAVASGAPLAAGLLLHGGFTWLLYGSVSPAVIYLGAGAQTGAPALGGDWGAYFVAWPAALATALGYLLDQKEGLLAYGPHFVLACAGIAWLARHRRRVLVSLVLVALAYVGPYALSQQLGGQGPPVRPLMAVMWVLAGPLGIALALASACRGYAALRGGLLALAAVLTAAYAAQPELLPHDYPVLAARLLQSYTPYGSGWWRLFPLWVNVGEPNRAATAAWTLATLLLAVFLWRHGRNVERGAAGGPFGADAAAAGSGWRAAQVVVSGACLLVLAHHALVLHSDRYRPTALDNGLTAWVADELPPRAYAEPGGVWAAPGRPVDFLISAPAPLLSLDVALRTLVPAEVGVAVQGGGAVGRAAPGANLVARLAPRAGAAGGAQVTYHVRLWADAGAAPADLLGGEDERYLGVLLQITAFRER